MTHSICRRALIVVAALASTSASLAALGTTFTYQGRLAEKGNFANGKYDMTFRLCKSETCNDGLVLESIALANVPVVDGLFTVQLEFAASYFSIGSDRWLEIVVEGTTLCPRQELTAAPYAFFSARPWQSNTDGIYYTDGLVGIGDSSPAATLTVGSGDKFQVSGTHGSVGFVDDLASIQFPATSGDNAPMILMFASGTGNADRMVLAHSTNYATWGLQYQDVGDQFNFLGGGSNVLSIDLGSKRVGVGTNAPEVPLHITGGTDLELASGGFLISGNVSSTNIVMDNNEIQCRTNGAGEKLYLNYEGGDVVLNGQGLDNVGIGTASPSAPLTVYKETGGTAAFLYTNNARVMSIAQYDSASSSEAVYIYSASNTDPALYVYNTNAPAALIVAGTAQVSVLEVTGADVAEKFPASETLEPGTVVMIDKENPGKLCMSRGAYTRCVAGIVSGANGLSAGTVLGNLPESKDGPAIALSGRVWVKVDASTGAIEPGDLLTTSDTPGHAMKVANFDQAQGAVIGKAMTGLKDGQGMVLVLVNLQ